MFLTVAGLLDIPQVSQMDEESPAILSLMCGENLRQAFRGGSGPVRGDAVDRMT